LNRINCHYEAPASDRGYNEHGVYRLLLLGARWSGLDISAAHSRLLLVTEASEEAKRCPENVAR